MRLRYRDTAVFFSESPEGYANDKDLTEEAEVNCIFLQNTGFTHGANQDAITSDSVCYPDPTDSFVTDNHDRLEGMYMLIELYGQDEDEAWYKVEECRVNRDHLLGNTIKNIELLLKKTTALERPSVS